MALHICCFLLRLPAGESVLSLGRVGFGGESCLAWEQLTNVRSIQATSDARAALKVLGNGPWSHGDIRILVATAERLRNVQSIHANVSASVAALRSRLVATWGAPELCGDSSMVKAQLSNVQQIQASAFAAAAVLDNGSLVT